jgi:hypothetical protein
LSVKINREGRIRFKGVSYVLVNAVRGYIAFEKKGKRLNDTKEHMMNKVYASDTSLDLLATAPMPLLNLQFINFPKSIMAGECYRFDLEIQNNGVKPLNNLKLKYTSGAPFWIYIGSPKEAQAGLGKDECLVVVERLI